MIEFGTLCYLKFEGTTSIKTLEHWSKDEAQYSIDGNLAPWRPAMGSDVKAVLCFVIKKAKTKSSWQVCFVTDNYDLYTPEDGIQRAITTNGHPHSMQQLSWKFFIDEKYLEEVCPAMALNDLHIHDIRRDIQLWFFLREEYRNNKLYQYVDLNRSYGSEEPLRYLIQRVDQRKLKVDLIPLTKYGYSCRRTMCSFDPENLSEIDVNDLLTCDNQKARSMVKATQVEEDAFYHVKMMFAESLQKFDSVASREVGHLRSSIDRLVSMDRLFPALMKRKGENRKAVMQRVKQLEDRLGLRDLIHALDKNYREFIQQLSAFAESMSNQDEE